MADFQIAQRVLGGFEGGYSNDPSDKGGETYKGIARKFHPHWPGWAIIEAAKRLSSFPGNLAGNTVLDGMVLDFYRAEFWSPFQLDALPQSLATEIYEQAVNRGKGGVTMDIQTACNALNHDKRTRAPFFPDLKVDGGFGNKTAQAVKTLVANGDELLLLVMLNGLQAAHYINTAAGEPSQRKFTRGWLTRCSL